MKLDDSLIDPVQYELHFNSKTQSWEYPNKGNAPTPWNKVSNVMKYRKVLAPGESTSFTRELSREMRCGEKVMFTAQIEYPKTKRTREIRSEEYVVPCLDTHLSIQPPMVDRASRNEIVNTLNLFWKAALSRDDTLRTQWVRNRPLELSPVDKKTRVPRSEDMLSSPIEEGSPGWEGQMRRLSSERWGGTFWFLRSFAQDIHTYNLELLKVDILAASKSEALVNVRFATETMRAEGRADNGRLVLRRDGAGWTVVSMQPIGEMSYRRDH
ncbi:MAG: hypothetical protein LC113_10610 [Acidobacteria bacterium]|nr:hypothetical protein [Acidobacteriota bacterium]